MGHGNIDESFKIHPTNPQKDIYENDIFMSYLVFGGSHWWDQLDMIYTWQVDVIDTYSHDCLLKRIEGYELRLIISRDHQWGIEE